MDNKEGYQPAQPEIEQEEQDWYEVEQKKRFVTMAEQLLSDSGLDPQTEEFKKAAQAVGEKLYTTTQEGLVDPLTGLLNKKGFYQRVEAEMDRAERDGYDVNILILDVNGLKAVNDTRGHLAGDHLLRGVSDAMKRGLRRSDVAAHLSGDEYAIMLPGVSDVDGVGIWNRLDSQFALHKDERGIDSPISIAAGLAQIKRGEVKQSADVADKLSYLSKFIRKDQERRVASGEIDAQQPRNTLVVNYEPQPIKSGPTQTQ